MNIESQQRWTLFRPMALARSLMSLALLCATASPAPSSEGTPEQRMACTPDVFRLCSDFIPDADEITTCLRKKNAELSDACRKAIQAEMTGARKRTAR
jgi:hypothetical protein